MGNKTIFFRILVCVLFIALGIILFLDFQKKPKIITSFEECAAAGYPIAVTYPPQCKTPDGKTFVEKISPTEPPQIANPAFCGSSSHKKCSTNSGCVAGGCSGQICQSINDEQIITTCEYKNCYDAKKYGLRCGCFSNECQWYK